MTPNPSTSPRSALTCRPPSSKAEAFTCPTLASLSTGSTSSPKRRLPRARTWRLEQKTDPDLKAVRRALLKDRDRLSVAQRARPRCAGRQRNDKAYPPRLAVSRGIALRPQSQTDQRRLRDARVWCTAVMRSTVEPTKEVARMIRKHFDGIVAWTPTRQPNGFMEALDGRFQTARRRARLCQLHHHAHCAVPDRWQAQPRLPRKLSLLPGYARRPISTTLVRPQYFQGHPQRRMPLTVGRARPRAEVVPCASFNE
jgi:hypothetical protein